MPATDDATHDSRPRGLAAVTALALAVGFAWGAVTIVRQDRRLLQLRTPPGPSATVDSFLQSSGMGTSEDLLRNVALARLPADADVAYIVPVWDDARQRYWQAHYPLAYVLNPRRVWVIAWCRPPNALTACEPFPASTDLVAAVAARHARHVLVAGDYEVPLAHTRASRLSSSLTLLDLP